MADALLLPIPILPKTTLGTANSGATTFPIDQITDMVEFVFQAEEAMTITKLGCWIQGSDDGAGGTGQISLQGVTTAGVSDGTIKGGGSPASYSFDNSGIAVSQFNWFTLDNAYTCTRGEYLAIRLKTDPVTIDWASAVMTTATYSTLIGFPYVIQNNAGVRTRVTSGPPVFGYASASKKYGYPHNVAYSPSIQTQEVAVKFTLPTSYCSTYKLRGCNIVGSIAAGQTLTMKLYSGGLTTDTGTVLHTMTFDTDFLQANAAAKWLKLSFTDSTLSTLTAGSTYRMSFSVGSGTNTVRGISVLSADDCDAYPLGQNASTSTRNGGDWTDSATDRLFFELLLDDLTAPTSGGVSGSRIFLGV